MNDRVPRKNWETSLLHQIGIPGSFLFLPAQVGIIWRGYQKS